MSKAQSIALVLVALFLASLVVLTPATVKAQAKTIVVPDDYPTIDSAIGNTINGDTILVRKGTYEGPINKTIVIDKSISIIGEDRDKTIIKLYPAYTESWILTAVFFTYTDALTITADSCTLQNLTIVVANPGGYLSSLGERTLITGCNVTTSPSTGIRVQGSNSRITQNMISGFIQLDGSYCQADENSASYIYTYGSFNFIRDNTCRSISMFYSNSNVILDNKISTDTRDFNGVGVSWGHGNLFLRNSISGFSSGFRLWFSDDNIIQANTVADSLHASLDFGASYHNTICLNNFIDNPLWKTGYFYDMYSDGNYQVAFPNMTAATEIWTDGALGNYWEDYLTRYPNATEVDNSGVGDTPYVINDNNTDPYPLIAPFDISAAPIQLPDWTNLSLPDLLTTPTFPPLPFEYPSPSPSVSSTLSPTPTVAPTPTPTEEPTQTSSPIATNFLLLIHS